MILLLQLKSVVTQLKNKELYLDLQGKKKLHIYFMNICTLSVASSNLLALRTRDLSTLTVMLQYFLKIPNVTDPKPCSLGLMLSFKV